MFTKGELLDAIDELETTPSTYQNCQKLATFYSLYDHLYGDKRPAVETVIEKTVAAYGDTPFYKAVEGAEAARVFGILNELMESVHALQPRLYDATLSELKDL